MFSLHHLKGSTYYIDAPTNVGVYKLNRKDCILIDTCYAGAMTEKLMSTLSNYDLNVKAILHTHAHPDHYGSDSLIKTKYNCIIGAPSIEHVFLENSGFGNLLVFNAAPLSAIREHYPSGIKVDLIYDDDSCSVEEIPFSLMSLKGHSLNQMGVATTDNIIFIGDAFLDQEDLSQVKMLYNYDTAGAITSMKSLLDTSYSLYVPSHGKPSSKINDTIDYNLYCLERNSEMLLRLLKNRPLSLDELMGILISKHQVTEQAVQYYIAQACAASLLSYLENKGLVRIIFDNGILKFLNGNE